MKMDFFSERLETSKNKETTLKKTYDKISNIRMLIFIVGIVLPVVLFFKGYKSFSYGILFAFVLVFIALMIYHKHISNELVKTKNIVQINEEYVKRCNGEWIEFDYNGKEFVNPDHRYTSDLDIFGENSLYQYMNACKTYFGRTTLADTLSNPLKDVDKIRDRQVAVSELSVEIDFCEDLQVQALIGKNVHKDPKVLLNYSEEKVPLLKNKLLIVLVKLLPLILVTTFVLKLINVLSTWLIPIILLFVQGCIFLVGLKNISGSLNDIGYFSDNISAYIGILKIIENKKFKSSLLNNIKADLRNKNGIKASEALEKLSRIADFTDLRYNTLLHIILNIIFLWDYHCVHALDKWKSKYGDSLRQWLTVVGKVEELVSFASLLQVNDESWSFPDFISNGLVVDAKDMGHPLINPKVRVNNNVTIKDNISVITGSNMSGKTTLLRTVGINLVLAYSGGPVCAKRFNCSIMEIYTSMRINDNLQGKISTFYAELLRIKMIIDFSKEKKNMIFLIDEIFRGTNSHDREIGARAVIKNLSKDWIIGFITTHDLELFSTDSKYDFYNFSEYYKDNTINFDYKLQMGKSVTTNAIYLMKMVGIDI